VQCVQCADVAKPLHVSERVAFSCGCWRKRQIPPRIKFTCTRAPPYACNNREKGRKQQNYALCRLPITASLDTTESRT